MTVSKPSITAQQREFASSGQQPSITTSTTINQPQVTGQGNTFTPSATPGTFPAAISKQSPETIDQTIQQPQKKGEMHTKVTENIKNKGLLAFEPKNMEEKQHPRQPKALPDPSPASLTKPVLSMSSARTLATSPAQLEQPLHTPSSPGRALSVSSVRLVSPAGSQIFERDVQESLVPNSPAIPNHMSTENHIPSVLDASSEAITDGHLSPDSVEIITHSSHQPVAAVLNGMPSMDNLSSTWEPDLQSLGEKDDAASNYGSLDTTDIRRLSFISFADVVQAEHVGHAAYPPGSHDSIHLAGLTSLSSMNMNRSPSPMRSPVSSPGLEISPPTSKSGSIRGVEMSPSRKPLGSPTSTHHVLPPISSEVTVETMAQALRRTGSTDLSGFRSSLMSPVDGHSRC